MLIGIFSGISLAAALIVCLCSHPAALQWLWMFPAVFAGSFLVLVLAAFLFLLYLCKRVDFSVPQEKDDPLYRTVLNLYIQSALPLLRIRTRETGLEKIPQSGRFLLVCNHTNDSDPILIMRSLPRQQLAFISKRENRDMFLVGPMMHKLQCQLINRENDREALKTILECIRILKEDRASVAVFPEGGIDPDGLLHKFRPGVFKIAQKANVPIVVCTLKNTKPVIRNILHFRGTDVEFHVLDVIPAAELKGVSTVEIAHRVQRMMAEDLGPELVAMDELPQ